jgi:hypothetical protein
VFRRLRYHFEFRGRRAAEPVPAPSERVWVHPSELPGSFERAALPPARTAGSRRFKAAIATSASALLLTGGALLALPGGAPPADASTGPHVATTISALPDVDRAAASSMLALVIYEGSHLGTATAMVLPPGDLAVTTTSIPRGASVMGRVLGQRSMALAVVGTDPLLGVTVLHIPTTVPVTATAPLGPAVSTDGAPTALTALASVRGTTTAAELDYAAAYLSSTPSAASLGRSGSVIAVTHGRSLAGVIAGTVVVDGNGRAVAAEVPKLGPTSFVSASFLQLLAQRIVLGSASGHGWLQLFGSRSYVGAARVDAVTPHGAAAGKVQVGDVILAMNAQPVRTMAEVGSFLYTSTPGQPVELQLLRGGHTVVVDVVLAASP